MKKLLKFETDKLVHCNEITDLKSKKDFEIYLSLCHAYNDFNSCLIDRTQTFEMPLKFQIRYPILMLQSNIQTYSDACDSRALEIIKLAEDKDLPIYFFWSGGVDSTVILTSFLSNGTTDQHDRFIVFLTQSSIKENPNFFKNFILGKLKYESPVNFLKTFSKQKAIFVHGECQDQMYATPGTKMNLSLELEDDATTSNLAKYIFRYPNEESSIIYCQEYIHILKTSALSVGVILEKVCDFSWWRSFCFGIQHTDVRSLQLLNLKEDDQVDVELLNQNIITFFMSQKFDQFIMQRVQNNKDISILKEYKKEAKEYIFAFDKDFDYFKNKNKIASGVSLLNSHDIPCVLDNSFKSVPLDKLIEYYNPNNCFSKYR